MEKQQNDKSTQVYSRKHIFSIKVDVANNNRSGDVEY